MKKRVKQWLILCAAASLLPAGCSSEKGAGTGKNSIYYLNADSTGLVAEAREVEGGSAEEKIEIILGFLQEEPEDIEHRSVFVGNIAIEKWELNGSDLDIYFNADYGTADRASELLLRAAVVQSLIQIEGVGGVQFFVDGASLTDKNGTAVGYMDGGNFVQNIGSTLHSYQIAELELYFASEEGDRLVSQTVKVRYNSNISLEKLVVEQLLKGPDSGQGRATMPAGTKVLSVSTQDEICYVNFDASFLNIAEQVNPKVTVYSLVNSIVDNSAARQVQILVGGEVNNFYQETIDLSKPLSRETSIIEEKEG